MIFPIIPAIGSALASIGTTISAACAKIGPAVVAFSQKVAPVIAQVVEVFKPIAESLGKIAGAFLQGAGILQHGESLSDFGERVLQASENGITTDKYDSFKDYMAALRAFEIDPDKTHKGFAQVVGGLAVCTWGLEDEAKAKPGSLAHTWLWPMVNPGYFTAERLEALWRSGALEALSALGEQAFMGKSLSGAEAAELHQKLGGGTMSEAQLGELYDALDSGRSEWGKLMEKVQQGGGEGGK